MGDFRSKKVISGFLRFLAFSVTFFQTAFHFMDQRLYDRVRSERASEQSLEHKRTDLINEKLEKSRESRIGLDQAKDIIDSETTKLAKSDDRFGNILSNPAFAIDQDDDDFKMRNPEKSAKRMRRVIRGEREDSSDEERDADLETDKGTGWV